MIDVEGRNRERERRYDELHAISQATDHGILIGLYSCNTERQIEVFSLASLAWPSIICDVRSHLDLKAHIGSD